MPEPKRLLELDGLRGIAALMVCLFHFNLFNYGITGVDLFFIISGFVIYMSLINAKTIRDFWFSRFIRLYPTYWLSIIIAVFSLTLIGQVIVSHQLSFVLGNLTMLQPLFRCDDLTGPYWTLYIEINFYVLISAIWITRQFKNVEWIILIGMAIAGGLILTYQFWGNSSHGYTRFFIVSRTLIPIVGHFQVFSAGILFYSIYASGINRKRLILLIISFVMIAITHGDGGGKVFYYLSLKEHLICCFIYYTVFILIIYDRAPFLKSPLLVKLGYISYTLYLIHQSFGLSLSDSLTPSIGPVFAKSIGIASSLILSYLITHYFDTPLRHWLKKKYNTGIKQTAATVKIESDNGFSGLPQADQKL